MADSSQQQRQRGGRRRALFTLAALLIPVLILGGAELALRASGIAELEPLFIRNPSQPEWSLANPRVIGRLFSNPKQAPSVSIETGFFRTEKADGALRLVVQGGSSAAGFPYGYGASLAGMLEQRLRREFPEREIEVVTTAMAAVNSYALWDFTDEILAIDPDAVLIYAGHNEFLGILGVGSAFTAAESPALTRAILKLRRLRLYRALEVALSPAPDAEARRPEGPLMARVAAERHIPLGSALYEAGLEQYRSNLAAILDKYTDAGVPVFVATVVSNERDQPPFASRESETGAARLAQAEAALAAGSADEALRIAELVARDEPRSARAAYLLAEARVRNGEDDAAARAWRQARDLDALRFRAPSDFRTIIEETTAAAGATLVDVESRFRDASPYEAVGHELMLEHLHPNVDGYFLLADAFHDSLLAAGIPGPPDRAVDEATARAEVPLSAAEIHFADYKLLRLVNDWPFTATAREPVLPPPRDLEEELGQALYRQEIDWASMQDRLKRAYRAAGNETEYRRLSLILADAFPFVAPAQKDAGQALLEAGRPTQAYRYFFRAAGYAPGDVGALKGLAQAAMAIGLDEQARRALERAEQIAPTDAGVRRMLQELKD